MSKIRYEPLQKDAVVFRLAARGGGHLPKNARKPTDSGWLALTDEDKAEAIKSGRPAGLSVWDTEATTPDQAIAIREFDAGKPSNPEKPQEAFYCTVSDVDVAVQQVQTTHADASCIACEVVSDPRSLTPPHDGESGHALIEGLTTAPTKALYKALRTELLAVFRDTP